MEAYKQWVWRNREYVHSLGSLANGLTWLLPEKFSASEIGPEAVTAILGIFTTINEHIIETLPTTPPPHLGPSSLSYPLLISILKDLETVVEVAAEHFYGEDRKWNFIILTEAIKALIRLALFRNTGYKMLLHGGETPNDDDDKDPNQPELQNRDRNHRFGNQNPWNSERRAMSALSSFGQNARTGTGTTTTTASSSNSGWSRRIQHQQAVIEPPVVMVKEKRTTISELLSEKGVKGALFVMGEVLYITRPLIYVLFIRRYGISSWIPWAISLSVDTLGMGILSNLKLWGEESKQIHFSQPERDELRRRKLLWALYLLRDPFFTKYTRQKLESSQKKVEPVPLIGFFTEKIVELLVGAQTRYTYISGS
ncbi:Peroxisome biogenesis protein 16 [Raphanus sativus]|uniref:Peroxisomal membrane protein PEX16 n=1 Tax=Raphanus sativus TaxID=3726 RepID=A0A6J0JIS7_RAPSA|nr:peroxisome biogenesis protein 16 isoform X2 [Raphanus sativus]KAJ4892388.1 Peroxisome biogenesis protein 16 [Raphanus sativus]